MVLSFRINGLSLRFFAELDAPVKFLVSAGSGRSPAPAASLLKWARLVELQANGCDCDDHHGNKYTGTSPADQLRYSSHRRTGGKRDAHLEFVQTGGGVRVVAHFQFIAGQPAFRSWNVIERTDSEPLLLEYAGSLALTGLAGEGPGRWAEELRLHVPGNNWCGECQWRSGAFREFGLDQVYGAGKTGFGVARLAVSNQGSWSTAGTLPFAAVENIATGRTVFWQIEHNGSWHWEISDIAGELYLRASGPTWREGHWSRRLAQGEKFETVPVVFGLVDAVRGAGLEAALRALTAIRRLGRRAHADLTALPVIFNDYMNCLSGDPTEEKLRPLIERAGRLGCEYFVIDAGWYADRSGGWWGTVGEWMPSANRFPAGLGAVVDQVRSHGMVPGLWLEIEVMGIHCPLAATLPDDWFFQRDGRRVIDHGRYQLDFRNPAVRVHADAIIERLVSGFGLGYIKMDYNINAGPGTDHRADSPGDGLLGHNRAYLAWIGTVFDRYPGLVIENCGSGGLRMDYAMLAQHPIQSVTDQTDYRLNAVIAAAAASAVAPEQTAIWSYPMPEGDEEETILNMINALLLRVHQSGCVMDLSARRLDRVAEGIALYKKIRRDIPRGLPFWPLGLPRIGDGWIAFGLDCGSRSYLAVWRLEGREKTCALSLPAWKGRSAEVGCIYPEKKKIDFAWRRRNGVLNVELPRPFMARLFCFTARGG